MGRTASVAQSPGFGDEVLRIVRDPLRMSLFVLTVLTVSRASTLSAVDEAATSVAARDRNNRLRLPEPAFPHSSERARVLAYAPSRRPQVLACCSAVFGISLGRTAAFILSDYVKTLVYAFLLAVSIRNVRDLFTLVWAYVIGWNSRVLFAFHFRDHPKRRF
jgi:hypothetical protein